MGKAAVDIQKVNWAEFGNDYVDSVVVKDSSCNIGPDDVLLETITTDVIDSDGKPAKCVKKVIKRMVEKNVHPSVALRNKWPKFGESITSSLFDSVGSNTAETVTLKLSLKSYNDEEVSDSESNENNQNQVMLSKNLYTKSYRSATAATSSFTGSPQPAVPGEAPSTTAKNIPSNKYVPPHARNEVNASSSDLFNGRERRDDMNTLRITNLSPDTTENDLKELTHSFGQTTRIFIARDREAQVCKGFAFVSYQSREHAEKALKHLDGHGYDSLILRVEWANPKD